MTPEEERKAAARRARRAAYERGRPSKPYGGQTWQRIRRQVLAEAGGICQMCGRAEATTVDHIVPLSRGGAVYARDNLQAACGPCNYGAGSKRRPPKRKLPPIRQSRDW